MHYDMLYKVLPNLQPVPRELFYSDTSFWEEK